MAPPNTNTLVNHKHLAIISIIPGAILFFVSALLMKDVTVISDASNEAHAYPYSGADPYERMAWIGLAEFGLFIGATQTLFSGIYFYFATQLKREPPQAFRSYDLIWVALNVIWIVALLTCFSFCFTWSLQLVERRGTAFVVFLGLDFAASVAVLAAWFHIKPNEDEQDENEAN